MITNQAIHQFFYYTILYYVTKLRESGNASIIYTVCYVTFLVTVSHLFIYSCGTEFLYGGLFLYSNASALCCAVVVIYMIINYSSVLCNYSLDQLREKICNYTHLCNYLYKYIYQCFFMFVCLKSDYYPMSFSLSV